MADKKIKSVGMELSVYVQIMAYGMVGSITLLPLSPVIVQSEEMKALPVECGSSEQVIAIMTAQKKPALQVQRKVIAKVMAPRR